MFGDLISFPYFYFKSIKYEVKTSHQNGLVGNKKTNFKRPILTCSFEVPITRHFYPDHQNLVWPTKTWGGHFKVHLPYHIGIRMYVPMYAIDVHVHDVWWLLGGIFNFN